MPAGFQNIVVSFAVVSADVSTFLGPDVLATHKMTYETVCNHLIRNIIRLWLNESADKKRPSVRLHCANKNQTFSDCDARSNGLCFSDLSVCDDKDFEHCFQIARHVFDRVLEGICGNGVFVWRCIIDRILWTGRWVDIVIILWWEVFEIIWQVNKSSTLRAGMIVRHTPFRHVCPNAWQ